MAKQAKNELNDSAQIPEVRNRYMRKRVPLQFTEDSKTRQSFKEECDINNILKQYIRTGVLTFTNKHAPQYGDFPAYDLKEALQVVKDANAMFADMPAVLRKRFNNNPEEFLEFIQSPDNRAEAEILGLIEPKAQQTAKPAEKAPQGAPKGESA